MAVQKWHKIGRIFIPGKSVAEFKGRAYLPFAEPVSGDIYRIYFSPTDDQYRGYIASILIDLKQPTKIIEHSPGPMVQAGELGCFDDSGAVMSCLVNFKGSKYLYYTGWSLAVRIPFYYFIGLAIDKNNPGSFKKYSNLPVMDRQSVDPFMTASPFVLEENGKLRMWYISGIKWEMENGKPKHYYHLKYAESTDGIEWSRKGLIAIDFKSNKEYAIARPCVLKEQGLYKMWYSYRASEKAESYRIGYAESKDGLKWNRLDEAIDLDVSAEDWDAEMLCYPFVFAHNKRKYMLYNGNGYGRSGFGLAVCED